MQGDLWLVRDRYHPRRLIWWREQGYDAALIESHNHYLIDGQGRKRRPEDYFGSRWSVAVYRLTTSGTSRSRLADEAKALWRTPASPLVGLACWRAWRYRFYQSGTKDPIAPQECRVRDIAWTTNSCQDGWLRVFETRRGRVYVRAGEFSSRPSALSLRQVWWE